MKSLVDKLMMCIGDLGLSDNLKYSGQLDAFPALRQGEKIPT